ncbi:MAG: sulfatase [Deltaproteobacteria bacterium]|nr:sulfatase [Deltaproteobacteria bacterium]MBW2445247.1 sulfatase [Deltaproteobacteria bacterium]
MAAGVLGSGRVWLGSVACLVTLFGSASGCSHEERPPPDLVLISVDTLRPDHLGAYGYPRGTTPHIDALAGESVRFDTAIAQAPSTLPSHASILSSLPPSRHGALYATRHGLPDHIVTVAEVLRDAGYRAVAFVGGGQLAPVFNLGQGFEVYRDEGKSLSGQVEAAFGWLDRAKPTVPVFMFLHTYEVHHPYRPLPEYMDPLDIDYTGDLPDHIEVDLLRRVNGLEGPPLELDAADLQHVINAYDAGIALMDLGVRDLVDRLRERGRYEDAAIIFTSDHGEEFGEHGRVGWHSHALYDHQLRVPLLLRLPRAHRAGAKIAAQVRSIDIAPTLLELAGVPAPDAFEGHSLLNRFGSLASQKAWTARSEQDGKRKPLKTSLRDGRHKWLHGQVFDLEADPGELADVRDDFPRVEKRLRKEFRAGLERARQSSPETVAPLEVPEATRQRLKELGYVE